MLKKSIFAFCTMLLMGVGAKAQDVARPNYTSESVSMRVVAPLSSRTDLIPAENFEGEILDGRSSKNKVIIGKGSTGDDILAKKDAYLQGAIPGRTPELVFDAAFSNSSPTDPALAVGPDHVVVVFNTGYRIFDKSGNALTDQLSPNNIFTPGGCCDLTISYDNQARRWVMSYLYRNGNVEVAVSTEEDPVNTSWNVYTYANIDDYQKVSVWSDGYYMTANVNSSTASTSSAIFVMDRAAMLAGEASATIIAFPLPGISTSGFYSPQAFNISNYDFPPEGNASIVYLQDDAYSGISEDHIKIWTVNVDFETPNNSTISAPQEITTTPFVGVFDGGDFSNLDQPNGGIAIDALQATVMNQAQFRQFDGYNSAIFNFVVNVDAGSGGERAGIRWYELRQNAAGDPWTIHQEGTYTAPEGKHAWMGGMMMDSSGNLVMGYTGMGGSTNTVVSSYYTGRFANDPLGTMTVNETLVAAGNGNIPGLRYGDYGKMDVDPNNDRKMWFINEYMATGGRANVVGVFQIAPVDTKDIGAVSIDIADVPVHSDQEDVTITIFNFGSEAVSNFEVSYTIDGGATVTETFTGTIEGEQSSQYTFAQKADLSEEGRSYTVVATVNLTDDAVSSNNSTTEVITNLFGNDIGVIEITAPVSGEGLGDETVTVVLENFGGTEQSNFDVSYTINGGAAVTETFTGTLASATTTTFTFSAPVNLSSLGEYEVAANTSLVGDRDNSNDGISVTISNLSCAEYVNNETQNVGPDAGDVTTSVITVNDDVLIDDVNVSINLTHTYVADLDIKLIAPNGTEVELSTDNGGPGDNYTNTVFDDQASTPITSGTAPFTGTFRPEGDLSTLTGVSPVGDWTLSISDDFNGDGGELLSWGLKFCSQGAVLSIEDLLLEDADFTVINTGNKQFKINLNTTEIKERLNLNVYNMLGQKLLHYRLDNENGSYNYDLDMSYAPSGVYIVKLGNGKSGLNKRIVIE
ncbi:proprotein convertase P-domain-containing protein [Aquimarina rhabdastrellae]